MHRSNKREGEKTVPDTETKDLNEVQLQGIAKGLSRADVIQLSNTWHIYALSALKSFGLTAEMLLNRKDGGYEFDGDYYGALTSLVQYRDFTVSQALKEIEKISPNQTYFIGERMSRDDVIQLSNFWHMSALEKLKEYGLTPEMLLNRKDGGHEFDESHSDALIKLVKERGFTINQALTEIEGLSSDDAFRIVRDANKFPQFFRKVNGKPMNENKSELKHDEDGSRTLAP